MRHDPGFNPGPLQVLVVDDDHTPRLWACRQVAQCGHVPSVADSGPAAVALCQSQEIDIVFMDILMPGMSGFDAALAIGHERALGRFASPMEQAQQLARKRMGNMDGLLGFSPPQGFVHLSAQQLKAGSVSAESVLVTDSGAGFDVSAHATPDAPMVAHSALRGCGLSLLHHLCESVCDADGGRRVTVRIGVDELFV